MRNGERFSTSAKSGATNQMIRGGPREKIEYRPKTTHALLHPQPGNSKWIIPEHHLKRPNDPALIDYRGHREEDRTKKSELKLYRSRMS